MHAEYQKQCPPSWDIRNGYHIEKGYIQLRIAECTQCVHSVIAMFEQRIQITCQLTSYIIFFEKHLQKFLILFQCMKKVAGMLK